MWLSLSFFLYVASLSRAAGSCISVSLPPRVPSLSRHSRLYLYPPRSASSSSSLSPLPPKSPLVPRIIIMPARVRLPPGWFQFIRRSRRPLGPISSIYYWSDKDLSVNSRLLLPCLFSLRGRSRLEESGVPLFRSARSFDFILHCFCLFIALGTYNASEEARGFVIL